MIFESALPKPDPFMFDVIGNPAPEGSKRAMLPKGAIRPVIVDGSSDSGKQALKEWRAAVVTRTRTWMGARRDLTFPLDEPLRIELHFLFAAPKSDRYRTRHAVKPDKDKLMRGVFDALTDSGLIIDDSRFYDVRAIAHYGHGSTPGCRIRIWPEGADEVHDRELLKAPLE